VADSNEHAADVPRPLILKLVEHAADQGVAGTVPDQVASVEAGAVAIQHVDEVGGGVLEPALAVPVSGLDRQVLPNLLRRLAQFLGQVVAFDVVRVPALPVPEVVLVAFAVLGWPLYRWAGVAVNQDNRVRPLLGGRHRRLFRFRVCNRVFHDLPLLWTTIGRNC